MKRILTACIGLSISASTALAFPTWMGAYGSFLRHDGGNPGTFTVLMNQDYWGLDAEAGIRVDGTWTTLPMTYVGHVDGNAVYRATPDTSFPAGAEVSFYFHGWDASGGHIWDSDSGRNYSFIAGDTAPDEVHLMSVRTGTGLGCYGLCGSLELDVRVKNMAYEKSVALWYTTDGDHWDILPLRFIETLEDGYEKWGYHNNFALRDFSLQFAIVYEVAGQTFWDNNGGQDYRAGAEPAFGWAAVSRMDDGYYWRTVGSGGSHAIVEGHAVIDIAAKDYGTPAIVGVVWTADGGASWHTSYAEFVQGGLPGGYDEYTVDIAAGIATKGPAVDEDISFAYAVFHDVDGTIYWDSNGMQNYGILME